MAKLIASSPKEIEMVNIVSHSLNSKIMKALKSVLKSTFMSHLAMIKLVSMENPSKFNSKMTAKEEKIASNLHLYSAKDAIIVEKWVTSPDNAIQTETVPMLLK